MSQTDTDSDRPNPTRIVADADVLAADLLVGGDSRAALDVIRSHSWLTLITSESLLDDAESVIASLSDASLAHDWRKKVEALGTPVEHAGADHPALAAAHHGNAAHILSLDDSLRTPEAGVAIRQLTQTSIKAPGAFVSMFEPAAFYAATVGGTYSGPDRDPRV